MTTIKMMNDDLKDTTEEYDRAAEALDGLGAVTETVTEPEPVDDEPETLGDKQIIKYRLELFNDPIKPKSGTLIQAMKRALNLGKDDTEPTYLNMEFNVIGKKTTNKVVRVKVYSDKPEILMDWET